jgi:hypothetical protein
VRRIPLACGLAVALTLAGVIEAQQSPLVGQPCPKFDVSHAVQGPAWQRDDLLGSIVVLDLFQLG